MNDLFTRNGGGIGVSFVRNPMVPPTGSIPLFLR